MQLNTILLAFVFSGIFVLLPAKAGVELPEPLTVQFDEGFGIIAAEVVKADRVASEKQYPEQYVCTFLVRHIPAQPLVGMPFPARVGDRVLVRLDVGYACEVEEGAKTAFANGAKYYLVVKHLKNNEYEHAIGASAVHHKDRFTDDDSGLFVRVRELASVPAGQKVDAWIAVIRDPKADEQLRIEMLAGLSSKLWPTVDPEAKDARSALRAIWNDPKSRLSLSLVEDIDCTLRGIGDFSTSTDRYKRWLDCLFTPTPKNLRDDNNRDNMAGAMLSEFVVDHPAEVGARMVAEMSKQQWPAGFRHSIASALLVGYRTVADPPAEWEPTLQVHFAIGFAEGIPWTLRLLAGDIKYGVNDSSRGARRRFVPNAVARQSLQKSLSRMIDAAAKPNNDEAGVAVEDLISALKALESLKADPHPT